MAWNRRDFPIIHRSAKMPKSADNNVVNTGQTEPFAGLFVQKIEIEVLVRQPMGFVLDKRSLQPQIGELIRQFRLFRFDLNPAQMAIVALNRRKDKISRKA